MNLGAALLGGSFGDKGLSELIMSGSLGGGRKHQPRSEARKFDTGLLNKPVEPVPFDIMDAPGLDVPQLVEEAEAGGPKKYTDLFGRETADKNLAAKQYVGASALSTGLQTMGAMQNIRQQEASALKQIQDQFEFQSHEVETNARIQGMARTRARTQSLIQLMNRIDQQAVGGGRQRQQIIRNPLTGSLI